MRPCAPVAVWQPRRSDRRQKIAVVGAARFQLQEAPVGAPLFFQVAEGGDVAVLEDQHLVAALLHVAQQVRGKNQAAGRRGREFPE